MKTNWLPGPIQPLLGREHVHVWLGELDVGAEQLASYRSLLSEDESDRAVRFRFDRHRNSYIAGRGMLRLLLARYLKADPKGIEFSYSEYGKPFIPTSELQFNLAHSGDLALAAFTLGRDIGVDLERERELSDALAIGDRFFSPGEREILRSLAEQEQLPAFFRCWSRKEAFIKAVGEGLSYPLDTFEVTFAPGEPARLLSIEGSTAEARQWSLFSLELPHKYHGAVAIRNAPVILRPWRFPGR